MKKTLVSLALFLLIVLFGTQQSFAKNLSAKVQTHRIPAGTILILKTYNTVATDLSFADDAFDAMLVEDQKIGNYIVLPKGTLFRGRVNNVVPNKMLSKSGVLYVSFDSVITPTGKQIPTNCSLYGIPMNAQGGITDGGNYGKAMKKNWNNAVNMTVGATKWGWNISNPSKYLMAPLGAIGGGTWSALYIVGDTFVDVFKKGSIIRISKDSQIQVMLTNPLDIPVN